MVRTRVQLTEAQLTHLRVRAAREGVSIAALVRRAVDGLVHVSELPWAKKDKHR